MVRQMKSIVIAALFATAGVAGGLGVAPAALADTCDPTATICQGNVDTNPTPAATPPVVADDEYPLDEDWYFNPAGGGTVLQPNHPSGGGGGHH